MTRDFVVARRGHLPGVPPQFGRRHGDGIGDLPGIPRAARTLSSFGVDAVWLLALLRLPAGDAGYDVANYRAVDPVFGTLADATRSCVRRTGWV